MQLLALLALTGWAPRYVEALLFLGDVESRGWTVPPHFLAYASARGNAIASAMHRSSGKGVEEGGRSSSVCQNALRHKHFGCRSNSLSAADGRKA